MLLAMVICMVILSAVSLVYEILEWKRNKRDLHNQRRETRARIAKLEKAFRLRVTEHLISLTDGEK